MTKITDSLDESVEPRDFLLRNLALVDQVSAAVCRRQGVTAADAEDFIGLVHLRLVENDYAVLRHFQGRSSLQTYITVLAHRWIIDERNRRYGKWRVSAKAQHHGPIAVQLERLLYRDNNTLDDALLVLRRTEPTITRDELATIAAQLPRRPPQPRPIALDEMIEVAVEPPRFAANDARLADRVSQTLRRILAELDLEDRDILRLHFAADMRLSQIARVLNREQKPLYRRLEMLLDRIRRELAADGIDIREIAELIGSDFAELDFGLEFNPKTDISDY